MATAKTKDISKYSLQEIHEQQLQNGFENDHHQNEIVNILGGIDNILTNLLNSNANITNKQINKIYQIIKNPQKIQSQITSNTNHSKLEDRKIDKNVTYQFNDDETILVSIFGSQRTENILNFARNRVIIGFLLLSFVIFAILGISIRSSSGLPVKVWIAFGTFMYLLLFIYVMVWILYCNKKAMKLLAKEFEFYFKLFYLTQFLIAFIGIGYFDNDTPGYVYYVGSMCFAAFSFLVMIFDTINIKRERKLICSSLAATGFAWMALNYSRMANFPEWQHALYQRTKKTVSGGSILSDFEISLIETAGNSAKILTIFVCKQFVCCIIRPNQSLIIRVKPWIKYQNSTSQPQQKHVKLSRIACILWWSLILLLALYSIFQIAANADPVKFAFHIGRFVLSTTGFCFFICNKVKYILMAISTAVILIIIDGVRILFMEMDPLRIGAHLFLSGLLCVYLLKVREFKKFESERMIMVRKEKENRDESDGDLVDDKKTEKKEMDEIISDEIMDGNKNSILFNNDDSKTYDEETMDDYIKSHIEMSNIDDIDAVK